MASYETEDHSPKKSTERHDVRQPEATRVAQRFKEGIIQPRIQQLKAEREKIQKKTFTKWMNSFLSKVCYLYYNVA